jgi:transposase
LPSTEPSRLLPITLDATIAPLTVPPELPVDEADALEISCEVMFRHGASSQRCGELYAIETDIRGVQAQQRLAGRQRKTKQLRKFLESWLLKKMKTPSRHSELAKAFTYALNQWPALTSYADNGWAEADNNIAENDLRMVSLGRKNVLFFGSDHGGERSALLYSLIRTCKLNGVDPERYLRHVLDIIANWQINRVSEHQSKNRFSDALSCGLFAGTTNMASTIMNCRDAGQTSRAIFDMALYVIMFGIYFVQYHYLSTSLSVNIATLPSLVY